MKRITLDWDFKDPILASLYFSRIIEKTKPHEIIIKRTKKGYHVFLWVPNNTPRWKYKNYLGNDPNQTRMDKTHKYGRQTLFNKKRKFRRSKYKIK